jgi:hypothetical protein
MPEPKPLPWDAKLPIRHASQWATLSVVETVDREMTVADVTLVLPRSTVSFVASWPRTEERGYLDVFAIARAEIPDPLAVSES